jgi:hypothetical protein
VTDSSSSSHSRLAAGELEREDDVLLRRQHRQQVEELEDEPDVVAAQLRQLGVVEIRDLDARDRHAAGGGLVEPREDVHERRLAGARRAHDRRQLPAGDLERDSAERVDGRLTVAVPARDVARRDDRPGRLVD